MPLFYSLKYTWLQPWEKTIQILFLKLICPFFSLTGIQPVSLNGYRTHILQGRNYLYGIFCVEQKIIWKSSVYLPTGKFRFVLTGNLVLC